MWFLFVFGSGAACFVLVCAFCFGSSQSELCQVLSCLHVVTLDRKGGCCIPLQMPQKMKLKMPSQKRVKKNLRRLNKKKKARKKMERRRKKNKKRLYTH